MKGLMFIMPAILVAGCAMIPGIEEGRKAPVIFDLEYVNATCGNDEECRSRLLTMKTYLGCEVCYYSYYGSISYYGSLPSSSRRYGHYRHHP